MVVATTTIMLVIRDHDVYDGDGGGHDASCPFPLHRLCRHHFYRQHHYQRHVRQQASEHHLYNSSATSSSTKASSEMHLLIDTALAALLVTASWNCGTSVVRSF